MPNDVLHFPDYQEKLAAASVKTGLKEAAVTAIGRIGGVQAVVAVLDSRFFMGSMSTAVGEKSHVRLSTLRQAPAAHHFFCQWRRTDAGGIFSLMQMAKPAPHWNGSTAAAGCTSAC